MTLLLTLLVFTHVTVIDTESARALPDMTVVVNGDRIAAVGPARKVKVPKGAEVIDARGKFLIPGLWDMHVHMFSTIPPAPDDPAARAYFVPRFVENGITGVRSMFDNLEAIKALKADIASGAVLGPRIVASGPILDGGRPYWPGSIACETPEQGREAVGKVKRMRQSNPRIDRGGDFG